MQLGKENSLKMKINELESKAQSLHITTNDRNKCKMLKQKLDVLENVHVRKDKLLTNSVNMVTDEGDDFPN